MRRSLILAVASWSILGAFTSVSVGQDFYGSSSSYLNRYRTTVPDYGYSRGQTYNPQYGYSTGYAGWGNRYGNSAPFQGNFHFAPGYGYGSIYGNHGHPGFGRFTGPAWSHPAAWGY